MAGRGPAPKPEGERRRRNKPPVPTTVVAGDGQVRGPELPDVLEAGWPAPTKVWWETWRSCAQASTFTDTDWSFLLDTALLHARLWSGDGSAAAELRLRVAKFGATPEDRLRLRMSIEEPEKADASEPRVRGQAYQHLRAVGD